MPRIRWIIPAAIMLLLYGADARAESSASSSSASASASVSAVSNPLDPGCMGTMVDPNSSKKLTANEALNNYFIATYIRSRESYYVSTLALNYNNVRLMTEPGLYREFVNEVDPANPKSYAATLGLEGNRRVKFKEIKYLTPQLAEVHVVIYEQVPDKPFTQHDAVLQVGFEYVKMKLTADERLLNPLGFRVIKYSNSDTAAAASASSTSSSSASAKSRSAH